MNHFLEVLNEMASGSFRLKSRELIEKHAQGKTLYRIAEDGGANYTTLHRWVNDPEGVKGIQGEVLLSFLLGLGLTLDEIRNIPLGDVFDFTLTEVDTT